MRFRLAVLTIDLVIVAFFIAAPLLRHQPLAFYVIDYVIAALLTADLAARAWCYSDLRDWLKKPIVWADLFKSHDACCSRPGCSTWFPARAAAVDPDQLGLLLAHDGRRYDDTRVEAVRQINLIQKIK